jgi:tryptophan synthase alpha chain
MGRIENRFRTLQQKREKALVVYLTAGDPSLETTLEMICALDSAGVDIIELGVPFSDPTADGPIIQAASQRALKGGTTLDGVLDLVAEVRKVSQIPVVLFGYYNPIFSYGNEKFSTKAARVGIDGILVVDLPFEESSELRRFTEPHGIHFISLIAPTTDENRIRRTLTSAAGFIYYVSITGVTGTLKPAVEDIAEGMEKIRKFSSLPIVVGFGISSPEQAAEFSSLADGIVVGSAFVNMIGEDSERDDLLARISSFARALKEPLISKGESVADFSSVSTKPRKKSA